MTTSVLDIQKGDSVEFVEYDSKTYILTATLASPFTTDNPPVFFKDNGSGTLVDEDNNPIESMEATRVHLTSLVISNEDSVMRTDGKIFNAIV